MSSSTALFSKLKILVAKLYKAEKLYASMRRVHTTESSPTSKVKSITQNSRNTNLNNSASHSISNISYAESPLGGQSLIEHANDIRSYEWYKVHHSFRVKLNDILSVGNTLSLEPTLTNMWHEFLADFEVAELDLQECNNAAKDSLYKEEYSYLFKLSSELIRRKARLQALKVIHDELSSLLAQLLSKNSRATQKQNFLNLNEALTSAHSFQESDEIRLPQDDQLTYTNVIPLRRKVAQ